MDFYKKRFPEIQFIILDKDKDLIPQEKYDIYIITSKNKDIAHAYVRKFK